MEYSSGTMSVKEAAKYVGVGLSVMYKLIREPSFKAACRIGERRIVIVIALLDEWLKENAERPIV